MGRTIVKARVRPARLVVLISKRGESGDFPLAVRFLSRLWGGMYGSILPAEPSGNDPETSFLLSELRPDYVYSVGLDLATWRLRINEACQPRLIRMLDAGFLERLGRDDEEEHITAFHIIRYLSQEIVTSPGPFPTVRLIGWDPESPLYPLAAALFGLPDRGWKLPIPHQSSGYEKNATLADLIKGHLDLVEHNEVSWLEIASRRLGLHFRSGGVYTPTIVLIDGVEDLSLFWNLRMAQGMWRRSGVLPLPATHADDPDVARLLARWVQAGRASDSRTDRLNVTSRCVPLSAQEVFAERVRSTFTNNPASNIEIKDFCMKIPILIPVEHETLVEVQREGQRATWLRPSTRLAEVFRSRLSWFVDLAEDHKERRSPFDLYLPRNTTTFELLNIPCPPYVGGGAMIPKYAFGFDSINVRCRRDEALVSQCLPTSKEVLEEFLSSHGVMPKDDEKRACYRPAIRLFGSLGQAAQAFSGTRGSILQELAKGSAGINDLLSRLKLGSGRIPELNEANEIEQLLKNSSLTARRITRERFRKYWSRTLPSEDKLGSLLEHWVAGRILVREWRIGPCPACQGTYPESRLTVSRPYLCPGCGSSIPIQRTRIVYSPHPMLKIALNQGVRPVALTGRFLKGLTGHGFLWLPGLKFERGGVAGDLDVVACCDGHLVFAECKNLEGTPSEGVPWSELTDQFGGMVEVAKLCGASCVVFSSLLSEYPDKFVRDAEKLVGDDLALLLLDRDDLENGIRWIKEPQVTHRVLLTIDRVVKQGDRSILRAEPG